MLRSPTNNDADNPHRRVILLLDMDCFYAQCETVRLGLDQSIPLALVQWRSALAVNYPAREFGIKRGDSFEVIKEKSKGKCIAIHLPVTPLDETLPPASAPAKSSKLVESSPRKKIEPDCNGNDGEGCSNENENGSAPTQSTQRGEQSSRLDDDAEVDSSPSAYDEEFNQPKDIREEMFKLEKNKMRDPSEGKACLDRYRLASRCIFSLIDETLAENLGRKNFILERASIDELFIDVTAFCLQSDAISIDNSDDGAKEKETSAAINNFRSGCDTDAIQSLKETVICHDTFIESGERNDESGIALRLGCHIASTVRRAVREKLGFTLSAGISSSKLVAKLAATFGKPNGQALVYPGAIERLMEETQLRKARFLGGKLGKKVTSLLPESETTMGSIARLLPLNQLVKAIGEESGRWAFDACRGIDYEEVKATLKVLPKSITAFKSFPKVSYPELEKWTALLARDVMKRVESDNDRNNRIPKSVTVGYTMVPGGAWIGKTFRLPFPADKDFGSRVQKLVDGTRKALTERGHSSFIRIGFSAIDFVMRPKIGIDSFFNKGNTQSSSTSTKRLASGNINAKKEACAKPSGIDSFFSTAKAKPANSKSTSNDHGSVLFNDTNPSPRSIEKEGSSVAVVHQNAKCTGIDSLFSTTKAKPANSKSTSNDHVSVLLNDTNPSPKSIEKGGSSVAVVHQNARCTGLRGCTSKDTAATKASSSDVLRQGTNITDEELARQLQDSYDNEATKQGNSRVSSSSENVTDKDKAFALQLQSSYDRENAVLSQVERYSSKRKNNNSSLSSQKKGNNKNKSKMDFFLKK